MAVTASEEHVQPKGAQTKVLLAASDAEAVDENFLRYDAEQLQSSLSANREQTYTIRTIATQSREEFSNCVAEFRPNVVIFSGRGTAQPNIRMLDTKGWMRQITGASLASLFGQAEVKISLLLLLNCGILRQVKYASYFARYLLSVKSKWPTQELPHEVSAQIFDSLGANLESLDSYAELASSFLSLEQFEVEFYGPEPIPVAMSLGLTRYRSWSTYETKSFEMLEHRTTKQEPPIDERLLARGPEMPAARLYRVWFGTNRKAESIGRTLSFSNERSDELTHGYCDVSIPKYHTIGSIGDPWWKRFPAFWRDNQLKVRLTKRLAESMYYANLRNTLEDLDLDDRVLLIFLHGYNVGFDEAARRSAQIGFDLQIPGITAFFSWPSKGRLFGYLADEATIEASEKHISAFIENMCERSGAEVAHIIAHSMGNRGLLKIFHTMAERVRTRLKRRLDQVILAAPDVDADVFKDLASAYKYVSTRTTMYVSSKDLAVASSALLHDFTRAGFTPPVTVVDDIDTIQVSNVDLTILGHGYVAKVRPVLTDIHALLTSNMSPNNRFGLEPKKTEADEDYWIIRA